MKKILAFFVLNFCFLAADLAALFIYENLKAQPVELPPQMPPQIMPAPSIQESIKEVEMVVSTITEEQAQEKILSFIKQKEGFSPRPYRCPAGVKTIGYGFTQKKHVARGYMTEKQATQILIKEIIPAAKKIVHKIVKVPLTPYQEAALVSFVFNCGEANLARLVNGKNRLNGGNYERTASLLMLYTKADGKTLRGLVERRKQEASLFLGKM
jgi:lysozyme